MNAPITSPARDHNNPPLPDRLAVDYADTVEAIEALAAQANAAPKEIEDDAGMAPIAALVKEATALVKATEAKRVAEKEPFLKAGREIDGFFRQLTERVERIQKAMNARLATYLRAKAEAERAAREAEERARREEERRQREEADRKMREAAEAEAANRKAEADRALAAAAEADARAAAARVDTIIAAQAAAAKPAELARTRTAEGVSTLRREWVFEIDDFDAIPLDVIRPYLPREAIEKAVRGFVRAGRRELPGVRIFETHSAMVR